MYVQKKKSQQIRNNDENKVYRSAVWKLYTYTEMKEIKVHLFNQYLGVILERRLEGSLVDQIIQFRSREALQRRRKQE